MNYEGEIEDALNDIKNIMSTEKGGDKTRTEENNEDILELTNPEKNVENDTMTNDNSLISKESANAAGEEIQNLVNTLNSSKTQLPDQDLSINDFLAQLIKPLLSEWLDENLPIIVREIVSKEINKIIKQNK